MAFRGAAKCCVCKRFCSSSKKLCQGCGNYCHDKCRQSLCCHPCNNCWAQILRKQSCVCGKSLRSLGVFVERPQQQPLTPSTTQNLIVTPPGLVTALPTKRNADRIPRLDGESMTARKTLQFSTNAENIIETPMTMHPHEISRDYLLRVPERGDNNSLDRWEDCRLLTKFTIGSVAGKETVWCTIECRLRADLKETAPWRPARPARYVCIITYNTQTHSYRTTYLSMLPCCVRTTDTIHYG